uniref:Fibrinogen C-terminal domain-containing protein n=1 Tax=Amphimedon queenslandica TaxID=400682 RepID=A0A1X7UMS3_AMPQE
VYCDMETDGGGWAVFQRREDGSVDFYRYWADYMNGFGNLTGEFWLGLSKIHCLTKGRSNTLRVELQEFNNNITIYAEFSRFNIGDNNTEYTLSVGGYSGTAQNSMYLHDGMRFSTRDDDNDLGPDYSCAIGHTGAWWYRGCHVACLNGQYFQTPVNNANGIVWYEYNKNYVVFKFSEMKVRRNN